MERSAIGEDSIETIRYGSANLEAGVPTPRPKSQSRLLWELQEAQKPFEKDANLEYRKKSIVLMALYVPILVLPWVLTCVLAVRPLGAVSYLNQRHGLTLTQLNQIELVNDVSRVLNAIAAVATIPLISALLAQAAVVYTQRHKQCQRLNLVQVFALADKGWSDRRVIWRALHGKGGPNSRFLWLGVLLISISAIQQPIQQLLVRFRSTTVMSCRDVPWDPCEGVFFNSPVVGFDPEPYVLSAVPEDFVVQQVIDGLAQFSYDIPQTHMWPAGRRNSPGYSAMAIFYINESPFFVTALDNGTTTGILRQHAMRFNSSSSCDYIPAEDFPSLSLCPGERPFELEFNHSTDLEVAICATGNYGVSPWSLSRNRQDITEDFFISVDGHTSNASFNPLQFTMHCQVNTTRGYFEIGNYHNDYAYGDLLDTWPDVDDMESNFNDALPEGESMPGGGPDTDPQIHWSGLPPSALDVGVNISHGQWTAYNGFSDDPHAQASGPLMSTIAALFGNQSFWQIVKTSTNATTPSPVTQICQEGRVPFLQGGTYHDPCIDLTASQDNNGTSNMDDLVDFLVPWLNQFNDSEPLRKILVVGAALANQAMLTIDPLSDEPLARTIWTSPGASINRPYKTLAGTIVVSVLIGLQLLGLAYLVWYIYSIPTWTSQLNALAVARIVKDLDADALPPVGAMSKHDWARLEELDGLVGIDVDDLAHQEDKTQEDEQTEFSSLQSPTSTRCRDEEEIASSDLARSATRVPSEQSGLRRLLSTNVSLIGEESKKRNTRPPKHIKLKLGAGGLIARKHAWKAESDEREKWYKRMGYA